MYPIIKVVITTVFVVAISEISKRSSYIGAVLASIPLISVLAMVWLYIDTKDVERVSNLATSIFWLLFPSLALFMILPMLLKRGINFYLSMSIAVGVTIGCYWIMVNALNHFGVKL